MMTMRLFILITATSLLLACSQGGGNSRTISIRVEGAGGQMAYFDEYRNGRPFHVDSVKLSSDGHGSLSVPFLPLDFYRIVVGQEELVVVLDSAESLSLKAKEGALSEPVELTGSAYTDAMRRFIAEARGFEMKVSGLRSALAADPSNQSNMDELNHTNSAFYESCKRFAQENKGSPFAISALSRLNIQQELDLFKQVRDELRRTAPRSGFFQSFREQVDRFEQEQIMMKAQEEEMKRLENMLPLGSLDRISARARPMEARWR